MKCILSILSLFLGHLHPTLDPLAIARGSQVSRALHGPPPLESSPFLFDSIPAILWNPVEQTVVRVRWPRTPARNFVFSCTAVKMLIDNCVAPLATVPPLCQAAPLCIPGRAVHSPIGRACAPHYTYVWTPVTVYIRCFVVVTTLRVPCRPFNCSDGGRRTRHVIRDSRKIAVDIQRRIRGAIYVVPRGKKVFPYSSRGDLFAPDGRFLRGIYRRPVVLLLFHTRTSQPFWKTVRRAGRSSASLRLVEVAVDGVCSHLLISLSLFLSFSPLLSADRHFEFS